MDDNQLSLAMAVAALLAITAYQAWKNPSARTLNYGLVMLFGFGVMILGFIFVPPDVMRNPLFVFGLLIAVGILLPVLLRWRLRGKPEAQAAFRQAMPQGKWKPSLWWAPLLFLLGFFLLIGVGVAFPTLDSGPGFYIVFASFLACESAAVFVLTHRLFLWWRKFLVGGN